MTYFWKLLGVRSTTSVPAYMARVPERQRETPSRQSREPDIVLRSPG